MTLCDKGKIAEGPGREATAREPRDAELTPAGTGKYIRTLQAALQLKI